MLAVEFTLYRFVCDLGTFTGLFSADVDGRQIPDTAAFTCCWSRVPRAKQSSLNPAQVKQSGTSSNTFFKSLGPDMALTFASAHTRMQLNGDTTVLTFQLRPTEFEGGDIPVIAKGTLDPVPYFGKPKKNYAIKLRDASGQVIGKLLFALEVSELDSDKDGEEVRERSESGGRVSPPRAKAEHKPVARALETHTATTSSSSSRIGSNSSSSLHSSKRSNSASHHRSPSDTDGGRGPEDRRGPSAPAQPTEVRQPTARSADRFGDGVLCPTPTRPSGVPGPNTTPPRRAAASPSPSSATQPQRLHMVVERVSVKPDAIDLDHPAPLLLESEYYVKVRFGTQTCYTAPVVCRSPRELLFGAQQLQVILSSPDGAGHAPPEKLRFSLWENEKQVAGFSLDPDKFRVDVGKGKEYAIPFRYHPTQQSACLDVTVTRTPAATRSGASSRARTPPQRRTSRSPRQSPRDGGLRGKEDAMAAGSSGSGSSHHRPRSSHSSHGRSGLPHHHRHHHERARSDGSRLSPQAAQHNTPPPAAVPVAALPPPQPPQAVTASIQFPPSQHHVDPQQHQQVRQRSTNSPPPRPTNVQQQQQAPPPAPLPPAKWTSLATHMIAPPADNRRSTKLDSPLLWGPLDTGSIVGITEPAAPKLVAKRCDSSPRALGVPENVAHETSRDRGTPLRSCLPRDIDRSGLSTYSDDRQRSSPKASALVPPPQQQRPTSSPRRRRSPAKETSVVAEYMARAELAKSQNEVINSARRESAQLRRLSPPRHSPTKSNDAKGSARRRHRHSSGNSRDGASSAGRSGSRHRRHHSRSPRRGERDHRSGDNDQVVGSATGGSGGPSRPPTDITEHERYLAQVMARLNQQARAPVQRTSLVEEWLGWRDEASQRNRRCSSVLVSDRGRSPSVAGSVISRDDSVASIVSRRATPLPTKSFANFAMQSPFQPEYSRPRRTSSVSSLRERPPLISSHQ